MACPLVVARRVSDTERVLSCTLGFVSIVFLVSPNVVAEGVDRGVLCGPKCANHVLRHFGKGVLDPIELTLHLDEFDNTRGTTLGSLAVYLETQGLYTRVIRISNDSMIDWPHPTIVHLDIAGKQQHFVVLHPREKASDNWVTIFDGISRMRRVRLADWMSMRSGNVLLPSADSIPARISPVRPATPSSGSRYYLNTGLFICVFGAIIAITGFVANKRGFK